MERHRSVNPEKLNIGLFCAYPFSEVGGVQEAVQQRRKYFESQGHNVWVWAPVYNNHRTAGTLPFGKGFRFNLEGTRSIIAPFPVGPGKIRQVLKDHPLDIAHYDEPQVNFPALEHLWFTDANLRVITFHAVKENVGRYYLWVLMGRMFKDKVDARSTVSKTTTELFQKYFPGDYKVIPNGVDTERFRADVPKIGRFMDGKINILYAGRLEERKGVNYLIDAYKRLKITHPQTRLIIVGAGPQEQNLKNQAADIEDIEFPGRIPDGDLPSYYSSANIFCSPAYRGESFGIVLLEAMSTGIPIVAGNNPGYRDVIAEGENGFLTKPQNPEDLCLILSKLVGNSHLRHKMGTHGRQIAVSTYDSKVVGGGKVARFLSRKPQEKRPLRVAPTPLQPAGDPKP